jgi:hypothetical protein
LSAPAQPEPAMIYDTEQPNELTLDMLRTRADEACKELAEITNEPADQLWEQAVNNQFAGEKWQTPHGNCFWGSFLLLRAAEQTFIQLSHQTCD